MVKLYDNGVYILENEEIVFDTPDSIASAEHKNGVKLDKDEARKNTMAYNILKKHNVSGNMEKLNIKFDKITSHDITYVGIVQTARASGLKEFPIPYVLTNCHNSLCAVGGTINEDDHMFGLSCAKKYGGIYVPAHQAVIHQYMREMMAGVSNMILGSDSHTRYGALGTMAMGEGGPELVKQLLNRTYDIDMPKIVCVYLTGKPKKGVGPQDVALAIIGAVFKNGFVKNKVMEFIGDGINNLSVDYRNAIDVMTTETTCLSSVWKTDNKVKAWYEIHKRPEDFKYQKPEGIAYYDGLCVVDLSKIESMIALPFHPSNVYTVHEFNENTLDILDEIERNCINQIDNKNIKFELKNKVKDGKFHIDQGVIAGCAGGTFENICAARDILKSKSIGSDEFSLSVYPSSQPVFLSLLENGSISDIMLTGATIRSAFCGPCFGAGDVPSNASISLRHVTRNFPNREGSKVTNNQIASVILADARTIAATAVNKGILTAATDVDCEFTDYEYKFNDEVYKNRCYFGYGKADKDAELKFGPNIVDWPEINKLNDNILMKVVSFIDDPVTTTDELIPSGETSSYRSNPLKLAEFALSRKDPSYVPKAKEVKEIEVKRAKGEYPFDNQNEFKEYFKEIEDKFGVNLQNTSIGSTIHAQKAGAGSAREQAASCQRVLFGMANIAKEYATKRYRSNLINWGMFPFICDDICFENGDYICVPDIKKAIIEKTDNIKAYIVNKNMKEIMLHLGNLTDDERKIILAGCLINFYKENN